MNLAVAKLVLRVVDVQGTQKLFHSFPAIYIRVLRDGHRIEDPVAGKSQMSNFNLFFFIVF